MPDLLSLKINQLTLKNLDYIFSFTTRLETQTKECNMHVSLWVANLKGAVKAEADNLQPAVAGALSFLWRAHHRPIPSHAVVGFEWERACCDPKDGELCLCHSIHLWVLPEATPIRLWLIQEEFIWWAGKKIMTHLFLIFLLVNGWLAFTYKRLVSFFPPFLLVAS